MHESGDCDCPQVTYNVSSRTTVPYHAANSMPLVRHLLNSPI